MDERDYKAMNKIFEPNQIQRAISSFEKHILTQKQSDVVKRLSKFNTPNYIGITMSELESIFAPNTPDYDFTYDAPLTC